MLLPIVTAISVSYFMMVGVTIFLRKWSIDRGHIKTDIGGNDFGTFFRSILWPIYLPILIPYLFLRTFKKPKFKMKGKSKEIAPGVPCPVTVFVNMAKANLLQGCVVDLNTNTLKNVNVTLYCSGKEPGRVYANLKVGKVTLEDSELSEEIKYDLAEFRDQVIAADLKRKEAERVSKIQLKAIDGIEALMD